jgi:cytochrome c-type biogenesis protein CcmH
MNMRAFNLRSIVFFILLMSLIWMAVIPSLAQDNIGPVRVVTDDEVNAISKKLFCPVCENIPLDACGTAACADWRYEIRLQLEAGMTEQEIIDDFIYRFGERVVHIPKALHLRLLSLAVPVIAIVAALYLSIRFFNNRRRESEMEAPSESRTAAESDYHALLEKDVAG